MKISERFALDEWLCDYPRDKDYLDIIQMMESVPDDWTHEAIELWEVVENYPLGQVAEFIESTRKHFESAIETLIFNEVE